MKLGLRKGDVLATFRSQRVVFTERGCLDFESLQQTGEKVGFEARSSPIIQTIRDWGPMQSHTREKVQRDFGKAREAAANGHEIASLGGTLGSLHKIEAAADNPVMKRRFHNSPKDK
jgi:hypothetical protein